MNEVIGVQKRELPSKNEIRIAAVNLPTASCGASKRKVFLGAAAPKPPLAIPPPSKLGGILAIAVNYHHQRWWLVMLHLEGAILLI